MTRRRPHRLHAAIAACLLLAPGIAIAGHTSLYSQAMQVTRREMLAPGKSGTGAETAVEAFTAAAVTPSDGTLSVRDVDLALKTQNELCAATDTHPHWDELTTCPTVRAGIQYLTEREQNLRTLGRDLQILAAPLQWSLTGAGLTPRTIDAPDGNDLLLGKFQDLGTALSTLITADGGNTDQLTAAVWRYHDGLRVVQDGTADRVLGDVSGYPGTALQTLPMRWPAVEAALGNLGDALRLVFGSGSVAAGETVLVRFPPGYQDLLPDNVGVQATLMHALSGSMVADVSLLEFYPMEPVPPSLCIQQMDADGTAEPPSPGCTPILPGSYPPPLQDGKALCTRPDMRDGYLCRPFQEGADTCGIYDQEKYPIIHLTECESPKEKPKDLSLKPYCPTTCPLPPASSEGSSASSSSSDSCSDVSLTVKPPDPQSWWTFPPYNPSDFYTQEDAALCSGIHAQAPAVLCNWTRQQEHPALDNLSGLIQWFFSQSITASLATQKPEQPALDLEKAFMAAQSQRLQTLQDKLQSLSDQLE